MSSAKRRLERNNSPSIFTPLFSQFNLLNMLSSVAVNSLGEMVSPCLTPLDPDFLTLFVQMYCHWAVRIYVFQDFYVHIFYSLFYCNKVRLICYKSSLSLRVSYILTSRSSMSREYLWEYPTFFLQKLHVAWVSLRVSYILISRSSMSCGYLWEYPTF